MIDNFRIIRMYSVLILYSDLGFFLEERYFFPSHGEKWVFIWKKTFLLRRNWEETPKGYSNITVQTDVIFTTSTPLYKQLNVMPHH